MTTATSAMLYLLGKILQQIMFFVDFFVVVVVELISLKSFSKILY